MKALFLLVFGLSLGASLEAQDTTGQVKKSYFYATAAFGYANKGVLLGGSVNVLFPLQFGIYIKVFTNQYKSKQLPADYDPGTSFFGNPPTPQDVVTVFSTGAIKEISLAQRAYMYKAGLEFGPCILFKETIDFTHTYSRGGWFGYPSNYDQTMRKTKSLGLLLRPKFRMLDQQNWGIELGSSIILFNTTPFFSIEMSVTSGNFKLTKRDTDLF